jgi:PAS domain S-box-containing protein
MNYPGRLPQTDGNSLDLPVATEEDVLLCPIPERGLRESTVSLDLCGVLEDAGCPLAPALEERLRFETLLAELSATFVNLASDQVDAQIESALKRLVEFLRLDRGGLAEWATERQRFMVTHSYPFPQVPRLPPMILNDQLPWYAQKIREGAILRLSHLPDALPPEATAERAYCLQTGLKAHVMIPLTVMGTVVGALGFSSFHGPRDWPDDLIQRLRLIGEMFTNAVAHKRADMALRESESRFRLLAESAPVMVWMSGPDKLCTYFNQHWLNFTGRPLQQELGDGWTRGVHPDDLGCCLQTFGEAFDAREPFHMEYRLRQFDGAYRWVLDTGVPRIASDGTFEGYIGSAIDVTDQRQVEQALRAREGTLRHTRENLRKLAARLIHAQEEERRRIAREMHDDWTQRLALLGIDLARLEICLGEPENARRLLQAMQEQVIKLSEDVHVLSRQLHPSILDDLGLVEALHSECANFSQRERITVVYQATDVPDAVPREVALCLYRVAQEALRNLAKHAAVSQAAVTLAATDAELLLRIRDEGIGFDPGELRFQPGLGLSSMEERVRLVEGQLGIQSATGQGTTIEVRVPLTVRNP